MKVICLDLEGVLVPEIWISVAARTGIDALKLTTRDIADYDQLMQHRLAVLDEHSIDLAAIQDVIAELEPMDGALDFVHSLREGFQLAILSDTFYEFAEPLMRKLDWPMLLCHRLVTDNGAVTGYKLRQKDPKRCAVRAFHDLQYKVLASGDSYNDSGMLDEADAGFWFRPPDTVIEDFPQYPVHTDYLDLYQALVDSGQAMDE
jgi:phosphoserine/homoserine phosphotransferase